MSRLYDDDLYAYLIFDLSDVFLIERRVHGIRPQPIGRIRFFITASLDPVTDQPLVVLSKPLELYIVNNRSGYRLFFGEIRRDNVKYRHSFLTSGRYEVRIEGEYYLPAIVRVSLPARGAQRYGIDLDEQPDMATSINGIHRVDLVPGLGYQFPSRSTTLYGALIVRTAQGQNVTVANAQVAAVDAVGNAVSNTWTTDERGNWLLLFGNAPSANPVTVRFILPGTGTQHTAQIELVRYMENTFPPMVFIGE